MANRHKVAFVRMRPFAIVGFYTLLALVALYNPLAHLATHVTGSIPTDFYHFHWNYWWMRHAFATGQSIYLTDYVFAPYVNNLAFHTLTPFFYPIWALVEPLAGTVAAMTAIFAAAMTASATAFYALLRREGVSVGLALVGGAMLQLTPLMFTAIFWTNINLMGWFWLPLLVLVWGEMARVASQDLTPNMLNSSSSSSAPPLRGDMGLGGEVSGKNVKLVLYTLLLGAMLWGMVMTDLQYPLLNAFVIVPYALWMLWRAPTSRARLMLIGCGAAALVLALALLWFAGPLPYILSFERDQLAPTPADRAVSIPFPLGYLWHDDPDGLRAVSVGAVLLPLIALAIILSFIRAHSHAPLQNHPRAHPSRWFWLALVPLPLVLSAGAAVTLFGVTIPLPYVWLHNLFGGMFRYPERLVPVFLIPGVLFAMLTLTPLLQPRRHARWLVPLALLVAVILDSRMLEPFPIQPLPTPYTFYEAMGREPYDYVVVEVPTAGMSGEGIVGEAQQVVTQFYGITHGKRMVTGHISRVPISHYWYMRTDDPMMAWLGQRRYIEPQAVEAQMRERIFSYPIGYFVIHRDLIGGVGSVTDTEVLGYFNSLGDLVCPVWVEGEAVVYRTAWHPDGCPPRTPQQTDDGAFVIDIGAPDDVRYIGWGWHYAEQVGGLTMRWTGDIENIPMEYPQTQVYVDLPSGGYELTITAQAFHEPRTLRLLVNGQPVGEPVVVGVDSLAPFTFTIPANVIGDGQHVTLTLDYDATVVPAEVGQGEDRRRLALAVDTITFRPLP